MTDVYFPGAIQNVVPRLKSPAGNLLIPGQFSTLRLLKLLYLTIS